METQQQQQEQEQEQEEEEEKKKKRPTKTSKEVYFSILPDRYEPLLEEEEEEEHRARRKRRFKKCRKNLLKALRFISSCLMLGLQNAAASYASPAAVVTVVTHVQRGSGRT